MSSPFNQPQIADLDIDDSKISHIACQSERSAPLGYIASICGFFVPLGEESDLGHIPHCAACDRVEKDNEACRSCKQAQLIGWAKRIGVDDIDCHYNAKSDVLEVTYTFGRRTDEKENSK